MKWSFGAILLLAFHRGIPLYGKLFQEVTSDKLEYLSPWTEDTPKAFMVSFTQNYEKKIGVVMFSYAQNLIKKSS